MERWSCTGSAGDAQEDHTVARLALHSHRAHDRTVMRLTSRHRRWLERRLAHHPRLSRERDRDSTGRLISSSRWWRRGRARLTPRSPSSSAPGQRPSTPPGTGCANSLQTALAARSAHAAGQAATRPNVGVVTAAPGGAPSPPDDRTHPPPARNCRRPRPPFPPAATSGVPTGHAAPARRPTPTTDLSSRHRYSRRRVRDGSGRPPAAADVGWLIGTKPRLATVEGMIERHIDVTTPDGTMPTLVFHPEHAGLHPVVLSLMDAPSIRPALTDMARRLASAGYYVMLPFLYYRVAPFSDLGLTDEQAHNRAELMASITPTNIVGDAPRCWPWRPTTTRRPLQRRHHRVLHERRAGRRRRQGLPRAGARRSIHGAWLVRAATTPASRRQALTAEPTSPGSPATRRSRGHARVRAALAAAGVRPRSTTSDRRCTASPRPRTLRPGGLRAALGAPLVAASQPATLRRRQRRHPLATVPQPPARLTSPRRRDRHIAVCPDAVPDTAPAILRDVAPRPRAARRHRPTRCDNRAATGG